MERITYSEHEEPIVLSKALFDLLLKQEHSAELIALYLVSKYLYQNKKNYSNKDIMELIGWNKQKIYKYAQILHNLINN